MKTRLGPRWRTFWVQRSHARFWFAMVTVLFAAGVATFTFLPTQWQQQTRDGASAFGMLISQVMTDHGGALMMAALLILLAMLTALEPRPQAHPYRLASTPSLAQVAVYVDAENQLAKTTIRPFVGYLRKRLDGQRADLLYFADTTISQRREVFKELYRFGFRPVDVPHQPLGGSHIAEIVDVELSLHAYRRALLATAQQHFIFVTADGAHIPLIYRIRELGHRVSVWAVHAAEAYPEAAKYLDFEFVDLVKHLKTSSQAMPARRTTQTSTASTAAAKRSAAPGPASGGAAQPHTDAPPIRTSVPLQETEPEHNVGASRLTTEPPSDGLETQAAVDTLQAAIEVTFAAISDTKRAFAKTSGRPTIPPRTYLHDRLGNPAARGLKAKGTMLADLGYGVIRPNGRRTRAAPWLQMLQALGAITTDPSSVGIKPALDSRESAERLLAFLKGELVPTVENAASRTPALRLRMVCERVGNPNPPRNDQLSGVRKLLRPGQSAGTHLIHAESLCRCARALGLLSFLDITNGQIIFSPLTPEQQAAGFGAPVPATVPLLQRPEEAPTGEIIDPPAQ